MRDMINEAKFKFNGGDVSSVPSQSSDDVIVLNVQSKSQRRHAVSLSVNRDQEGNILSCFGTCSCGQPRVDRFPCQQMYTVSLARILDEQMLVPPGLTTAASKYQYPIDHKCLVPSGDEIMECESLAHLVEPSPGFPVIATAKPGLPRKKRVCSVMEKFMRRTMTPNDNR